MTLGIAGFEWILLCPSWLAGKLTQFTSSRLGLGMIPAAYMPESVSGPGGLGSSEAPDSPEDPSQSRQQDEEEVVCLHCGLVTPASDVQQQLVAQITK